MSKCAFSPWMLVPLLGFVAAGLAALWQLDPRVGRLWLNTTMLACGACAIAVPLGTLAASLLFKTDVPGRHLAGLFVAAMLFVPLFLVTGAWNAGFGIQGWHTLTTNPHLAHEPWLTGWRAAVWVHGLAGVPWVVLIVGAGLRAVEAELEEDAALCGSPFAVLCRVTLPRTAAAMVIAGLWVAIVTATEISVTDFFQVRTFAEEVYTQSALGAFDLIDPGSADSRAPLTSAGLWVGLLLSSLLALATMAAARQLVIDLTEAPDRAPWSWRLGRLRWPAAILLSMILLLIAGVPLANLVYKAGARVTVAGELRTRDWSAVKVLQRVAAAPLEFRGELLTSAAIGSAAATAALAVAIPLAWSMRLASRVPWLRLAALSLCLTIPGPLLGLGVIRLLNQPPDSPLSWLAPLYDSFFAPWLVQTIRALPLVTLILWAALSTVPQVVLDAAATEGAGWWRRLLQIALPQRWPAVLAAWLIGLTIAVGELAATVLVMPPARSTTISIHVFQLLHYGVDDRLAAISLALVIATGALTAIATTLLRRIPS